MTGGQVEPFCSNMFSPTVTLVHCNFNHEIMLAMSTDRSGFVKNTDIGSKTQKR